MWRNYPGMVSPSLKYKLREVEGWVRSFRKPPMSKLLPCFLSWPEISPWTVSPRAVSPQTDSSRTVSPHTDLPRAVSPLTVSPHDNFTGREFLADSFAANSFTARSFSWTPPEIDFLDVSDDFQQEFFTLFFWCKKFFWTWKIEKKNVFFENVEKLHRRVRNVNILPRRVSAENKGLGSVRFRWTLVSKKEKTWRNFPPGLARIIEG